MKYLKIQTVLLLAFAFLLTAISANDTKAQADSTSRKEMTEKRTKNTKTFMDKGNRITVQKATYSVHYFDGDGWKDIDTTIKLLPAVTDITYGVNENNFKVKFGAKGSGSIRFQVNEQFVSYKGLQANDVTAVIYGNKITYPQIWTSTDLQYEVKNDLLKMELHLSNSQAPKTFTFDLHTKNVTYLAREDGSIDFIDQSGKTVFKIPRMWVKDSSSEALRYDKLSIRLTPNKDHTLLELKLDDQELTYPITIDPSTQMVFAGTYYYDTAGRLDSITLQSGQTVDYQYDLRGNLIKRIK